jgi:sec-independent protein translocase protein TatA
MGFSIWHMLFFLIIVLIFMGPSRLEKMGPSLGKALRGFKKGLSGDEEGLDSESKVVEDQTQKLQAKLEALEKKLGAATKPKSDDDA